MRLLAYAPIVVLPTTAYLMGGLMPRWGFMWAMAMALFAGCKWLTYCEATTLSVPNRVRELGYLLGWPGMDADAFLSGASRVSRPPTLLWIMAGLKTTLGVTLTWIVARTLAPESPLLAGWIGMAGLVFVLHFGIFDLLSLAWRRRGVDAVPLMRNPLRATSLAEFWGRRWNTAFHELAVRFTFKPLRSIAGLTGATLLVFIVSGLIHELVISLPAQGGYGLPTGYFVLQGVGLLAERGGVGRRAGLGRGMRGWMFTVLITAGPVCWLFPRPFVENVILPMLRAIGAI
jgi:alginate O-acetyltransferase complex protein AlgI